MLANAKRRAKVQGVAFDIEPSDIRIPRTCPVLGIPLKRSRGQPTDNSPSLDRIEPALGYVRSNIAVISYRANRIKNDSTPEELLRVYRYATGSKPRRKPLTS